MNPVVVSLTESLAARDFARNEAAAASARQVAADCVTQALARVHPNQAALTAIELLQLAAQHLAAARGYAAADIAELAAFAAKATKVKASGT